MKLRSQGRQSRIGVGKETKMRSVSLKSASVDKAEPPTKRVAVEGTRRKILVIAGPKTMSIPWRQI